ncbi:DUF3017 domain-containing protein [Streptomyces sp. NPDC051219]|uniref:DUF3017 domain-containing protein n=1 Tax=Streptomyces sp. NPDC051219 TaxID=3155283 RepID=UPI00341543B7
MAAEAEPEESAATGPKGAGRRRPAAGHPAGPGPETEAATRGSDADPAAQPSPEPAAEVQREAKPRRRAAGPQAGAEGRRASEPGPEPRRAPAAGGEAGGGTRAEAEAEDEGETEHEAKGVVSAPGPDGVPVRTTRRFPSVTRDTARPEGGGRAAPGDAPAPARQWPMLTVLGATAAGLIVTAVGYARIGCLIIGLALITGAVLRRVLPSVGMLAVRSRFTDMVTYGLLGVAITLLALVAQPKPWLELPFLEDAVHFTVR